MATQPPPTDSDILMTNPVTEIVLLHPPPLRPDLSIRDPALDGLCIDKKYVAALEAGEQRLPERVRTLEVLSMQSSNLLVRIIDAVQPLCIVMRNTLPDFLPESVRSVVTIEVYSNSTGNDETDGALLRRWFPLAGRLTANWSAAALRGFLSLPGPPLRSFLVVGDTVGVPIDVPALRPHLSTLTTVELSIHGAYGPRAAECLDDVCRELKHAPQLSTLHMQFMQLVVPPTSGLTDLLSVAPNLTDLSIDGSLTDPNAFGLAVWAIGANPADTLRSLSLCFQYTAPPAGAIGVLSASAVACSMPVPKCCAVCNCVWTVLGRSVRCCRACGLSQRRSYSFTTCGTMLSGLSQRRRPTRCCASSGTGSRSTRRISIWRAQ
jgi:hypothetical protein